MNGEFFDRDVLKNLMDINSEMKEEVGKDEPDGKKIEQLNIRALNEGLKLNTFTRNYNNIPY